MNAGQLRYAIEDVLERNSQRTGCYGSCPWCGAGEYGIDSAGQPAADHEAVSFEVAHLPWCAESMLEAVLRGDYVYLNPPPPVTVPPMPMPHLYRIGGPSMSESIRDDMASLFKFIRRIFVTLKIMHPDAAHLSWVYDKPHRVHRCMAGDKEVGTVTLSPPHVSPTLYTWAIAGRGETGHYTTLRNAKRRVENKVFELAIERHEAKRNGNNGH